MTQPPNWQGNSNAGGGWNQPSQGQGYPPQGPGQPQQYGQQPYGQGPGQQFPPPGGQPYGYPPQEPKKGFPTVAVIAVLATLLIVAGGIGVFLVSRGEEPTAEESTAQSASPSASDTPSPTQSDSSTTSTTPTPASPSEEPTPAAPPVEPPPTQPSAAPSPSAPKQTGKEAPNAPSGACYFIETYLDKHFLKPSPCDSDPAQGVTLYAVSSHEGAQQCTGTLSFNLYEGNRVAGTVCLVHVFIKGHCYSTNNHLPSQHMPVDCNLREGFQVADILTGSGATCPEGQKAFDYGDQWDRTYCLKRIE